MKLKNEELKNINGGGFGVLIGIGIAVTFIIGFVDGYVRPSKCR